MSVPRLTEQLERESEQVAALRRQADDLRAEVDASHLRELDGATMIENLREEVDRYQEQMRLVVAPAEQDNEAQVDYERLRKQVIQEKQQMAEQMQQLKRRLGDMYEEQESLERKNSAANLQVNDHVNLTDMVC